MISANTNGIQKKLFENKNITTLPTDILNESSDLCTSTSHNLQKDNSLIALEQDNHDSSMMGHSEPCSTYLNSNANDLEKLSDSLLVNASITDKSQIKII